MEGNRLGDCSEIIAANWLMRKGYDVFRNMSSVGAADLFAWHIETGRKFLIDVKTATLSKLEDGSFNFNSSAIPGHDDVELLFVSPCGTTVAWSIVELNQAYKAKTAAREVLGDAKPSNAELRKAADEIINQPKYVRISRKRARHRKVKPGDSVLFNYPSKP